MAESTNIPAIDRWSDGELLENGSNEASIYLLVAP